MREQRDPIYGSGGHVWLYLTLSILYISFEEFYLIFCCFCGLAPSLKIVTYLLFFSLIFLTCWMIFYLDIRTSVIRKCHLFQHSNHLTVESGWKTLCHILLGRVRTIRLSCKFQGDSSQEYGLLFLSLFFLHPLWAPEEWCLCLIHRRIPYISTMPGI